MTVDVLDPAPTLAELATTANREHAEVERAATSALEHAIRAGDALLAIQAQIGLGSWLKWLETNFDASSVWANCYMRVAYYKDRLPRDIGVGAARDQLRGLPPVGLHGIATTKVERTAEIQRLNAQGLKQREIAEVLNITTRAVFNALNPEKRREYERRWGRKKAEQRRVQRQLERERSVRRVGGSVADAYSLVRRTLQALEQAASKDADREARAAIDAAMGFIYKAEDEIVKASKLSAPGRTAA